MPSRIIRESLRTSHTLNEVSAEAERQFTRLIVVVDDHGRFHGDPRVVLASTFPLKVDVLTPATVEGWLQDLVGVDAIRFYTIEGRRYLYLPSWEKHQRRPQSVSKFPAPPVEEHGASTMVARSPDGQATVNDPLPRSRSRELREGNRSRESRAGGSAPNGQSPISSAPTSNGQRAFALTPAQVGRIQARLTIIQSAPLGQQSTLAGQTAKAIARELGVDEGAAREVMAQVDEAVQ